MARKKDDPKPLFDLKHDFYESLDHVLQQTVTLLQVVDQAIQLDQVKPGPVLDILKAKSAALRKALMSDD